MISLKKTRRLLGSIGWNSAVALTLLVPTLWIVGCATDNATSSTTTTGSTTSGTGGAGGTGSSSSSTSTGTGTGGEGGADLGPCGKDCSTISTPQCLVAVCNEGQYLGTVGACVVIPAKLGVACDDGLFCTANDSCDGKGACEGGPQNDCGVTPPACTSVTCDETSKTCGTAPADEGSSCAATGVCEVNGSCHSGLCQGEPKDCSFSPLSECNQMACNPATGDCEPTPDASKDGDKCILTGDLCKTNRTCSGGQCGGGSPKDCSAMTAGCVVGTCNPVNGSCDPKPVPAGGPCFDNITACHVGMCDASAACVSTPLADGTACSDHDSCTNGDVCTAGACAGAAISNCLVYLEEGFETCPDGWTLGGDWQCGTPTNVGPAAAHTGTGVIATQLHGKYNLNQEYDTAVADSPPISLASATHPRLSFWTWIYTEGDIYDGFNLKISTNGGASFSQVTTVQPAYDLDIDGQDAWGGDQSGLGWQNFSADLGAYAGQQIILRFAFRSDSLVTDPGVYIDDLILAEEAALPLSILTTSPLADTYTSMPFSQKFTKKGGSTTAVWSIVPGGTNTAWLSIDPSTGVLSGTPTAAEIGPVSVTVHVEEPAVPANFAEKVFTFNVVDAAKIAYSNMFEGACPNSWTLTGDWQCGTPTVGPAAAYSGTQCIATKLASNYSDGQSWTGATATSPIIDLTNVVSPKLTFWIWIDTEGGMYDGVNLKISTNGGTTYSLVNTVTPAYSLLINGEAAWGGHQAALGWQPFQANLAAYAGQSVRLRFAFRSDGSGNYPGVYIDDVLVVGN